MSRLADHEWECFYSPTLGGLVDAFYVPALACATRYDRQAGYFSASALAVASRGIEGLIVNGGRMRLLVGHALGPDEVAAIERGEDLRAGLDANLQRTPLAAPDRGAKEALELLAWMVANGHLEVKVAIPCDDRRRPLADTALFHAKSGIIEDKVGDRLLFNGSINETERGWRHNIDTFHVFTSWEGLARHIDAEEREFQALWVGKSPRAVTFDVPAAKREELLRYAPEEGLPVRLQRLEDVPPPEPKAPSTPKEPAAEPQADARQIVWSFIAQAPRLPNGGDRVGEATSTIQPWPHQVRAFERMYHAWPPRLLIADEVGLGKTIQAGLLVRQAWLAGHAKRILVMAPKSVLRQWQLELREKFNLNWPIYDGGRLSWAPSPAKGQEPWQKASRNEWHQEPCVIVSSHLMRRTDRARELLEDAQPWDLIIVDEAHHARRRGGGTGTDDRPNQLLRLMKRLKDRSEGLVLLTATPMQVSPVEVWDLLDLLGLPRGWSEDAFLRYFETVGKPSPSNTEMAWMAAMFREVEAAFGPMDEHDAKQAAGMSSNIRLRKVLRALREESTIRLKQLETDERKATQRLLKLNTPVKRLISRHTRNLLRKYYEAGKINTPIASRAVDDRFVDLTEPERRVYSRIEDYISSTYNNAAAERRTAVGFVMTIYRRRLASSFYALQRTLEMRLEGIGESRNGELFDTQRLEEDLSDDEVSATAQDADEAANLEREALQHEERDDVEALLRAVKDLPADTKAGALTEAITELHDAGYGQVMVFTQFTDTMDFLRQHLTQNGAHRVMCYSGRGGEVLQSGRWQRITRDETKKLFRERAAEVLLCTDAAAEGLNFQFCGALVNYDMPWNPMRVEQRIGRIDRVGQKHGEIRVVNLHYRNTVETDVYLALRDRIRLFETFVGNLQPILSRLPKQIENVTLAEGEQKDREKASLVDRLADEVRETQESGFDIDSITEGSVEEKPRPEAPYGLRELGQVLQRQDLLPPGEEVDRLGAKDFKLLRPGMSAPVRVTTDAAYYEAHADSVELWSPGAPVFPEPPADIGNRQPSRKDFFANLDGRIASADSETDS